MMRHSLYTVFKMYYRFQLDTSPPAPPVAPQIVPKQGNLLVLA
jgi:hypothetical protein